MLEEQNIADVVCKKLGMPCGKPDLTDWIDVVNRERALSKKVEIAIVGKYVETSRCVPFYSRKSSSRRYPQRC